MSPVAIVKPWTDRYYVGMPHTAYSSFVTEARQQIASNVRAMMGRRSVTQTALAEELGLSQPVVSRRVRGEMPFDTHELIATASFLDCDLAELVEGARSRCFSEAELVSECQPELIFD